MKFIAFILFSLLSCYPLFAQESYTGLITDNFAGMASVSTQPADIVDNRYKAFLGTSFNVSSSNNFNSLNINNLVGFTKHPRNEYRDHRGDGFASLNTSIDLIGAMVEYKHKNAFGYNLSIKTYRFNSGLPGELTFGDFEDYADNANFGTPFQYQNLSAQALSYTEHGFHYGRIIQEDDQHYLKAGVTAKLLNGLDASYFFSESGELSYVNPSGPQVAITNTGSPIQYGQIRPGVGTSGHRLGFGLDLGVVYEYRSDFNQFKYNMDGKKNIDRYDVNKYDFKIGVSITNIGSIKFLKDTTTYDFDANGTQISGAGFLSLNNNHFNNVNGILSNPENTESADDEDSFRFTLPTNLNLQFDYHLYKDFYVAYAGAIPVGGPRNPNRVKHPTIHSVVPRYENKNWGVSLPISIKGNGQFLIGGVVRKSLNKTSVFVGSHNLTFLFGKRKFFDGNIFAGISIALRHSVPSDRDFDEVSDAKDRCPDDAGPWELQGCPDTDNDGIIDLEDHCIYDQGDRRNNGCPDRDGDGVIDVNDHCPDEAGLAVHYGCPDRDKDGVIDAADRCPDVPGIELNNGCPFENSGCCTDNDGDGISNEVDQCPEVAGSVYNNGCPIDSTNINTINLQETKTTLDPNHTGEQIKNNPLEPKEDNGGFDPVEIKPNQNLSDLTNGKEIEKLTIYFESDQSYIEQNYIQKLNELLKEVKATKKENIHFVIIGHTDKDGSDDYNLILSRKRAETVRKRLQSKGIDFDRIKTYYYGEWEPLNSEDNENEKQINRRVEVIIVKK